MFLLASIRIALSEDGPDLTSQALFTNSDILTAEIIAKSDTVIAGLPIIPLVLEFSGEDVETEVHLNLDDGDFAPAGTTVALLRGPAPLLLKAERIILNFLGHMSGVATLVRSYVEALKGTGATLLDTRKTLPGLRYPEKYAVLCGGGRNHRLNLAEMLMLKDNHIDRAGSITQAVQALRTAYSPCPPIEVECRTMDEVREAAALNVDRIMFDNMTPDMIREAMPLVPESIETEASGNVDLDTIAELGKSGVRFISVGRLTHSAPAADLSMTMQKL